MRQNGTTMAQTAFQLDYSVTGDASIPRSAPTDPVLRKLFEYLSLGLTPDEILEASDKLRQSPREDLARLARDCYRHSICLSSSQRSSLISNFSRLSWASSFSTSSQEPDTNSGPHTHYERPQSSRRVSQAQETAPSPSVSTNTVLICFSCNKRCSTQSALKRHQEEKCERKVDWTCPDCQWTGERLIRHYATSHRGRCAQCCSLPGERVCDDCRVSLSGSYLPLPRKQAWGCPYCCICFVDNFSAWNAHCTAHHHRGDTWSWSTMIWSLLQQFDLSRFGQYSWTGCDWSILNDKTGSELRDDLQRLRCPKHVQRYQQNCELQIDEALVRYTHRLVTVGPALAAFALSEPYQQASTTLMAPSRTQDVTCMNHQDMCSLVPPPSKTRPWDGPSDVRQGLQTQTSPLEIFFGAHHHQNNRPDSATIPQAVRLQHADSVRAPQGKPGAQFSGRTPTVPPVSGDGLGNMPNGQSVESSTSGQKCTIPNSNAGALQMLCHHSKIDNLEARSVSHLPDSVERYTSPEASRTVPRRLNAGYQTEDAPVIPPQTRPMSDLIFQQYCSYPTSSSEADLIFQQYCSYPTSSPEAEP